MGETLQSRNAYGIVLCGGGPAAIGPVIAAAQSGYLEKLLDLGILLIESVHPGPGGTAHYRIRANSLGGAFLECLDNLPEDLFGDVFDAAETRALREWRSAYPPLSVVAGFLARLGRAVAGILDARPNCRVVTGSRVEQVRLLPSGVQVQARGAAGEVLTTADRAVLALGGRPLTDFERTPLAGGLTLEPHRAKVCHSEEFVDVRRGPAQHRIDAIRDTGHVAIVGGSHSAWAVAAALLADPRLGPDGRQPTVTILQRSPTRLFYLSRADADADGYSYDQDVDVCQASGRVNRFGGLRGPAFDVARRALGLAGDPVPVRLVTLTDDDPVSLTAAAAALDAAGTIIVATGYEAALPHLFDRDGTELIAARSATGTMVTAETHLVDEHGVAHPELLAYGLGAGLPASTTVGGESSYHRRADGVWLYQNDVGRIVLDQLFAVPASR